jgi:hypothetical protein
MKNFSFVFACVSSASPLALSIAATKDAGTPDSQDYAAGPSDHYIFYRGISRCYHAYNNANGWVKKNNSADEIDYGLTDWGQGIWGTDKSGLEYGFPAYSYSSYKDEYAFSGQSYDSISSWLISPGIIC